MYSHSGSIIVPLIQYRQRRLFLIFKGLRFFGIVNEHWFPSLSHRRMALVSNKRSLKSGIDFSFLGAVWIVFFLLYKIFCFKCWKSIVLCTTHCSCYISTCCFTSHLCYRGNFFSLSSWIKPLLALNISSAVKSITCKYKSKENWGSNILK